MIEDDERFNAYRRALSTSVRPGDVVLEIGCGPGVFGLLACQAGARKVYAIDSADIVHFARELAVANGFAERMEFIQSDSRKVRLPERANLVVSDLRGSLPFFGHAVATIEDARRRLLAPDGCFIPRRDIIKVALIEAGDFYSRLVSPWLHSVPDLNLSRSLALLLNGLYSDNFGSEQTLTEPQVFSVLDYAINPPNCAAADLDFRVTRDGTAHGLCLWFDTELVDGVGFSSRPGTQHTVYGQAFLPWLEPVSLHREHRVFLKLQANLVGERYVWRWETKICVAGSEDVEHSFKQSSFQSPCLSPESLRHRAADFVPALSEEGRADRWLLQAMNGKTSLRQIAQEASRLFPKIFPKWEHALSRAAELAWQFSR